MKALVINTPVSNIVTLAGNRVIAKVGPLGYSDVPNDVTYQDYFKYSFYRIVTFDEAAYYEDNFFDGVDRIPKDGDYEISTYIAIPVGLV